MSIEDITNNSSKNKKEMAEVITSYHNFMK